ncbi:MAG: cation-translocating P-type ATPase [Bifidobacteriaceae bacterium]|jgi:calcium-translocating P-type ATPase|nr:cation-translocating P-type ATPase [Bifidobacteriaceae bacterium]
MTSYGLSSAQAEASAREHGANGLTERETEGFWSKFKDNLGDPMIKILCVALAINVVFTFLGKTEWYESAGIAVAVLLATFVSTFSEYRNESVFQKLQAEASQVLCKVYRDGGVTELPIDQIVVGDSVLLQTGDLVPADGELVTGSLAVDQSVLNGETEEAHKEVMPEPGVGGPGGPDEPDDPDGLDGTAGFLDPYRLFRGSIVYSGNAVMRVTEVGDKSVYGQIADDLQRDDDRETPLKIKLAALAQGISRFGYIGGILIAVALLFQRIVIHNGFEIARITEYCSDWMVVGNDVIQALMLAVIIIVMAVPEGLPLMIAIVSALNMGKMLRDNVLVRRIAGTETAGSLNILFSDKTGTITKGQLEAMVFVDGQGREHGGIEDVEEGLGRVLALSIRHNTSAVISEVPDGAAKVIGGNATERAILGFVTTVDDLPGLTVVDSIPFDSSNKYSAARIEGDLAAALGDVGGRSGTAGSEMAGITLVKGAPERILAYCRWYYDGEGHRQLMKDPGVVQARIDALAQRAIRVLALATSDGMIEDGGLPHGEWTLVGIIGIRDEIREESISAIREVQNAGVQVVMITGDRRDTAVAVAKESGLIQSEDDLVLTSDELGDLSDDALKDLLSRIRVISRALPSDKTRLVRVAQELNLVVGMTGDGVNDSPALKAADVGFAMGGGTEVAKEASEIIIMDDNFNSIDKAILYGRTIFNSVRKFIVFQLTVNVSAVLINFVAPLLGMVNPLTITQILWVNLVMDTLAALAFGGEPALRRFMREKPKRRDESIVSPYMWSAILTGSLFVFAMSLVFLIAPFSADLFRTGPSGDPDRYLLTGYFSFFIFVAVFNAFNARTDQLNLFDNIRRNLGFVNIILLISVVQVLMTYFGGPILAGYGLTISEWGFVLLLAILIIPVDLIRKVIMRSLRRPDGPEATALPGTDDPQERVLSHAA